jgi:glycogen debranching enzyme
MFDLDLTLKANEFFLVGRAADTTGFAESGLYLRDTRFLHRFDLKLNGRSLDVLSVNSTTGRIATINMANQHEPAHTVGVQTRIELGNAMTVTIELQNFNRTPVDLALSIDLAADFRDMFDVRGWRAPNRGTVRPAEAGSDTVRLALDSLDGSIVSTLVAIEPAPTKITIGAPGTATINQDLTLAPGAARTVTFRCTLDPADGRPVANESGSTADVPFAVWSSNAELQQFMDQCDSDLNLLQTDFPEGSIPAAGIPWFIAPFGRDSLIVGLQTMHAYPERIAATLRLLAAHQGEKVDAFTEEQPGKILHELRYGEMARSRQIPHTPYFGSVDATPLFALTFAQHYLWHRDESLWNDLVGNVRRALEWIETFGDPDGDGFIEFSGTQEDPTHISQQGWKDSGDSLNHADGSAVTGPVALVEVQGYVYAAYATLARAAAIQGDMVWSKELKKKAKQIRRQVEDGFWLEDEGFYAQALDGSKQPVRAISSNPGHLLFCELPSNERAARVTERMMQPDLYAGWGIRTLSSDMPTYNPMSYHNGSIWPHDTSLTMAGFRHYGQDTPAIQLAIGLVTLGYFTPESRLAELYCGYSLDGHEDGPVNYPVSCIPQAWAAASAHLVLRTLLGLKPDFENRRMVIDPFLPAQFEAISVAGLAAFGERFDLAVHVHDEHYHVSPSGQVEIVVAGEEGDR